MPIPSASTNTGVLWNTELNASQKHYVLESRAATNLT